MKKTVTINLTPFMLIACLILAIMKYYGVINWSWWLVTAPLWAPFVIALAMSGIAAVVFFLCFLFL